MKPVEQLNREEHAAKLAQTITVRCADCMWELTGSTGQTRLEWAKHRRDEHHDDQVEKVLASLSGEPRGRRTKGGHVNIVNNPATLQENLKKARRAGAGHGAERDGHLTEDPPPLSPAVILQLVRRWTAEHGAPPRTSDWQAPKAVRGPYPSYDSCSRWFARAGWNGWAGMVAAAAEETGPAEPAAAPPNAPPDSPPGPHPSGKAESGASVTSDADDTQTKTGEPSQGQPASRTLSGSAAAASETLTELAQMVEHERAELELLKDAFEQQRRTTADAENRLRAALDPLARAS